MLARILPFVLLLAGCPDPTAAPEGGGMSDKPMGGPPGGEGAQPGGPGGQGAPGGPPPGGEGAGGGAPGGRPTAPGFKVNAGEGVKLSGLVTYSGSKTGVVRIDFLQQSAQSNFPDLIHSVELAAPGPWEVEAPKNGGEYWVVAFLDANGDGPSPGEPAARVQDIVKVGPDPITGLDLALSDTPELGDLKPGGKDGEGAPGMPPQSPPGGEAKPGEVPAGGAAGAPGMGAPGMGAPGAGATSPGTAPTGGPAGSMGAPPKPGDVPAAK